MSEVDDASVETVRFFRLAIVASSVFALLWSFDMRVANDLTSLFDVRDIASFASATSPALACEAFMTKSALACDWPPVACVARGSFAGGGCGPRSWAEA